MQWQRTFERIMSFLYTSDIPKFVFKSEIGSLLLAKRSLDLCYNGSEFSFTLQPMSDSSRCIPSRASPVKRPVARALCFDDLSEPITKSFESTDTPKVTMKRDRKQKTAKILVDIEVHRSARLSALHDGYRRVPCNGPSQIRASHTLKKRKTKST